MRRLRIATVAIWFGLLLATTHPAAARITRIEVTSIQSPTFGGTPFGAVGAYEKIVGRAFGEIDPSDPRNATITDLASAKQNAAGRVEYSMDVYLLKPVDMARSSRRLFYEANNRGTKLSTGVIDTIDRLFLSNDPTSPADAGDGFLLRRGFVVAWSGWDVTVPRGPSSLSISVPVAASPDGSPIVGPSLEEFVVDAPTASGHLSYPASSLDTSAASLAVRTHATDPLVPIAAADWEYVDAQTVRLLPAGTPFQQGKLYDLVYPAQQPLVAGLAFAATRDFVAFLRHAPRDDLGVQNPVAGGIDFVYGFGLSQPARFLRDFVHLGFNEDEGGRIVFDGLLNFIGGPGGGSFDHRFAQPGRTIRQHRDRLYPEIRFPFTWSVMTDPVTGRTDGRLRRCLASGTCPRIFDVNSENEYWNKSASLLHTDAEGRDLEDPPNVRFYLLSSLPHAAGTGQGLCQQTQNGLAPNPALRGLLLALDDWVSRGRRPPTSRVPRRGRGTLVPSLPQAAVHFPAIPGVEYNGVVRTGDLFDFGPDAEQGILTVLPPVLLGTPYPVFVPKTDRDGNDVAGIRLPAIQAPVATYSGWALRAAAYAGDDLCDASGQQIPFARTKAERLAAGDPRRSLLERYPTHERYVKRTELAAKRLLRQRLLADEDVGRLVAAAAAAPVP
jgi:alpha/beta hydrolase family protein